MFCQSIRIFLKFQQISKLKVINRNKLIDVFRFVEKTTSVRPITSGPSQLGGDANTSKEFEATAGTINDVKGTILKLLGFKSFYDLLGNNREHLIKYLPKQQNELPDRSMQDSFTSAILPIGSDIVLRDKYVGFLGTVRTGRLLEDMDLFAVLIAQNHIKVPNMKEESLPYCFVTVLVDKIDFTDLIPKPDADIRLSGHVSWVGKSSIECVVWMEQKVHGKWRKLTRALFLIAARDPTNTRAAVVNPLVPSTEEEKQMFAGGEERKNRRNLLQQLDLKKNPPNSEELAVVHEIFKTSIDATSKTFNKRFLPQDSVWMEDAEMQNIILSHPEDRNVFHKVFGGFLMRHAQELSWALAHQYCKHNPKLKCISDTYFHAPVDVSSLINMGAHVIYTEQHYMVIVVLAEVFDPVTGRCTTTNSFFYIYSSSEKVPHIVPRTYHESMWYIEGRRKFMYAMGHAPAN